MEFALKIVSAVLYLQAAMFAFFAAFLAWAAIDSGRWPINSLTVLFGVGAVTSVLVARWKSTTTRNRDEARRVARARRRRTDVG